MPKYSPFSYKQLALLKWWTPGSPYRDYDAIVCDGSIRAGKSLSMVVSFVCWMMESFDAQVFAFCGTSIGALRRNIVPLIYDHLGDYFTIRENKSEHCIELQGEKRRNRIYLFGGADERSADKIQGLTLAGVLFDEVALMPESFVEQATGRCSVDGAKLWFNCNPEHPQHWFYKKWIKKEPQGIKRLHLHFTMADNLSLSEAVRRRYMGMYTGTFYKRFILGEWVQAGGAVYPNFVEGLHGYHGALSEVEIRDSERYIAIDYGVHNPTVFLDLYLRGNKVCQDDEYYYNSREAAEESEGARPQLTNAEYYRALVEFVERKRYKTMQGQYLVERIKEPVAIIIDPSASSLIAEIEAAGRFAVIKADNAVLEGIRNVATLLSLDRYRINLDRCPDTLREFYAYTWDEKQMDRDAVIKDNDHAMDALRYFVQTIYVDERGLIYDGR